MIREYIRCEFFVVAFFASSQVHAIVQISEMWKVFYVYKNKVSVHKDPKKKREKKPEFQEIRRRGIP